MWAFILIKGFPNPVNGLWRSILLSETRLLSKTMDFPSQGYGLEIWIFLTLASIFMNVNVLMQGTGLWTWIFLVLLSRGFFLLGIRSLVVDFSRPNSMKANFQRVYIRLLMWIFPPWAQVCVYEISKTIKVNYSKCGLYHWTKAFLA